MSRWVRRKSTIQRLDKGSAGKAWARALLGLTAASLSIATGAAGLVIEYFFEDLSNTGADWANFRWFLLVLLVSLLTAILSWWWRDKLLNQGVVIDLTVDEIGKPADRSETWVKNAMTAFAVIHHPFEIGCRVLDADRVIDISSSVRESISDYETLLWRHHGNDKLVLAPGSENFPALFGLGCLAYLPGEMTLIEAVGKQNNADRHFIEFTGQQLRQQIGANLNQNKLLSVREVVLPTRAKVRGSTRNDPCSRFPAVTTVRFAYSAVRGSRITTWVPFQGTQLERAKVPTVYAGALETKKGAETHFSQVSLRAASAKRHSPRGADNKSKILEIDAFDAAQHLASSLAWTLWRYPNADVHVTARVPRTVAVAAGAILAADPTWKHRGERVMLPDFTERLKLWGSLRPTNDQHKQHGRAKTMQEKRALQGEPELALFEVFKKRTRTLPEFVSPSTHTRIKAMLKGERHSDRDSV